MVDWAENMRTPQKGDVYSWRGVRCEVIRVARNQTWADLQVSPATGETWTKRQPLPLPDYFTKIEG